MNVTEGIALNSTITAVSGISGWFTTFVFVLVLAGGFGLAIVSYSWFTRFYKTLSFFWRLVIWAVEGAGVTAAFYAVYWILDEAGKAARGIDPVWILYGITGFFAFAAVGWTAEKAWGKLKTNFKKFGKEKGG